MRIKIAFFYMVLILLLTPFYSPCLFADEGDIVKAVKMCDQSLIIEMEKSGLLLLRESDVGEAQFGTITTRALKFLQTGALTGYFDPGEPISVCGIDNVRPITVLELPESE